MSDVGRKPTDAKLGRSDNPAVWNPPPEPERGADFADARIRCESCEILRDQLRVVRAALHEALDAARTFNRGGMTWLEYDALLTRLASQHPRQ
jgi:hypothetical protein